MSKFKFSVGPWNVNDGVDVYGPPTRKDPSLEEKIKVFAELGFDAIQFHDDDVVPNINELSEEQIIEKTKEVKKVLDKYNLATEFVAPRLWMDPKTIDGGYTSNNAEDREFALWRTFRSIDIAKVLGTNKIVIWLAREGTVTPGSKDPVLANHRLVDAMNKILEYDKSVKILIEPKPNEPIDRSFAGTAGHVLALSAATNDPNRVGVLLESAHAVLAGLDPTNEMAMAISQDKLWGVHLNDQNGMKFDQDKSFGVENLRQAFHQVKLLKDYKFGSNGEYVGLDVKSLRTSDDSHRYDHLKNSLDIVKTLEKKLENYDYEFEAKCFETRDYESLEMYIMNIIMGNV